MRHAADMVPDRRRAWRLGLLVAGAVLIAAAAALLVVALREDEDPRLPLADREAAEEIRRVPAEPRPENAAPNAYRPTEVELERYRAARADLPLCESPRYDHLVTGAFTGTTDEVLQWAARKWGLDPDVARAVAVVESTWSMDQLGDANQSFGIMQVKRTVHLGTYPLSRRSTAFNADFWAASVRSYYDGCAPWLNDEERGAEYRPGDLWGSIGVWYAGRWRTPEARQYIARVRQALSERRWERPWF